LDALHSAGLRITAAHPIKAEMSVAAPKQQAREPIDLDIIFVCQKREMVDVAGVDTLDNLLREAFAVSRRHVRRLNAVGRKLSRNDVRVIITAQVARRLSWRSAWGAEARELIGDARVEPEIEIIYSEQTVGERRTSEAQLALISECGTR
jgi:adenine-specific DNA methylase